MATDLDLIRAIERAPLRTLRYVELRDFGTNVWRTLDALVDHGAITRLAQGVYAAPPGGQDGRTWQPTVETGGLAVATARFGNRNAVLMGIGAARYWAAIPRALAVTTVAVPAAGRAPVELERGGTLHLVPRDLNKLDVAVEPTELGDGLVTTPAQTMYDLLMKPKQGGVPDEAVAAAAVLRGQVHVEDLADVVERMGRANDAVRQMMGELERDGIAHG
ncbi:type IV toxin-antitoxin system AbiEi family antitoxin domain-containing protein [Microbacterium sp.]|uniref:type IV toxin-antitoxin system AbiEi family antitoxin domain-containing protein n=1 Tax=Microbacterium sp. TaxID=51671 RepID=UPI003A8BD65A